MGRAEDGQRGHRGAQHQQNHADHALRRREFPQEHRGARIASGDEDDADLVAADLDRGAFAWRTIPSGSHPRPPRARATAGLAALPPAAGRAPFRVSRPGRRYPLRHALRLAARRQPLSRRAPARVAAMSRGAGKPSRPPAHAVRRREFVVAHGPAVFQHHHERLGQAAVAIADEFLDVEARVLLQGRRHLSGRFRRDAVGRLAEERRGDRPAHPQEHDGLHEEKGRQHGDRSQRDAPVQAPVPYRFTAGPVRHRRRRTCSPRPRRSGCTSGSRRRARSSCGCA